MERAIAQASLHERERIGQDLHDSIAQDLAALRFLSEALADKASAEVPEFSPLVSEIRSAADRAYKNVHKLARGLCPVELDDRELQSALMALSQTVGLANRITCTFQSDGWCSACREKLTASCVYRIAAEAVMNAKRHANASRIDITLRQVGQQCILQVLDDGIGFELDSASPKGMGILNMSYRANLIGASLTIREVANGGTLVRCSFVPN